MPRIAAKESDVDDLKELLTLAARACGMTIAKWAQDDDPVVKLPDGHEFGWNPLTYKGDGAEMEDKLRISVVRWSVYVQAIATWNESAIEVTVDYADHHDEGTARRWASLRVAAAIGRSMK
jgi:hypothetical protein